MRNAIRAALVVVASIAALALSAQPVHAQAAPTQPGEPKIEVDMSCKNGTLVFICRFPNGDVTKGSTKDPVGYGEFTLTCQGDVAVFDPKGGGGPPMVDMCTGAPSAPSK